MSIEQKVKQALGDLMFQNLALATALDAANARIAQLEQAAVKRKPREKKTPDLKVVGSESKPA